MIDFYSQIKGKLLQPSVIVSYQRQAYVYEISRVRLTIDHHLCTYQNKKDFLNLKHGISIDNHYILEVKYNEFLPEIVKMSVQGISQKTSSYSKCSDIIRYGYCACFSFYNGIVYFLCL